MARDTQIIAAAAGDAAMAAQVLANAFHNDPAFSWILPDADARRLRLPRLFDLLFRLDQTGGMALKSSTDDAISLWQPPGHVGTPLRQIIAQAIPLLRIFGLSIGRALAVSNAIEAHLPRDQPCWYAHIIGVDTAAQGRGLGAAMVLAGVARANADGLPVYLETATASNVGFYTSLGFTVVAEWDVPQGPHFWSMLRQVG